MYFAYFCTINILKNHCKVIIYVSCHKCTFISWFLIVCSGSLVRLLILQLKFKKLKYVKISLISLKPDTPKYRVIVDKSFKSYSQHYGKQQHSQLMDCLAIKYSGNKGVLAQWVEHLTRRIPVCCEFEPQHRYVSLSKKIYPHCLVLVGSRNGFE